jgi:hypothetical protein
MTPFQAWSGQKPELSHLRPFGCDTYVFIHPSLRTKWKPKAKSCTLMGYVENTTEQYRVWNGQRIVVVAASNTRFDEQSYRNRDYKQAHNPIPINWDALGYIGHPPIEQDVPEERMEDPPSTSQPLESGEASMTIEPTSQTTSNEEPDPHIATLPTKDDNPTSTDVRRSIREKRPSFKLRSAFPARIQTLYEPTSYREAVKHPYSRQWEMAMKEEFEALDRNKT